MSTATVIEPPPRMREAVKESAATLPLADSPRLRLDFLDGLRGLAAFYVTIHHTVQLYMTERATPAPRWFAAYPYLIMGEYAVVMFIVLSGFCLMLPVARSEDGKLRGAFGGYMKRRAKRILPVYYVSLVVSLLLIAFVPGFARGDGEFWGLAFPAFDLKVILSHVFMLHALRPDTINAINPPMWSLGVEWLNYFLFPLLLLPVWRRLGNVALVVLATILSFTPYALWVVLNNPRGIVHNLGAVLHPADAGVNAGWYTLTWAHPWYMAMFAIGMAGAAMQYSSRRTRLDQRLLNLALHPVTTALATAFFALQFIPNTSLAHLPKPLRLIANVHNQRVPMDFIMGGLMILVILHCSHTTRPGAMWRALLQWRPALWLGSVSYSLYLFHVPVLVLLHRGLEAMHLSAYARLAALVGVGIPLTLLTAALSYRFLEKPMLSTGK